MNWRSASDVVFAAASPGRRGLGGKSIEGVIKTELPAVGMVCGACFEIASILARMPSVAGWEAQ